MGLTINVLQTMYYTFEEELAGGFHLPWASLQVGLLLPEINNT